MGKNVIKIIVALILAGGGIYAAIITGSFGLFNKSSQPIVNSTKQEVIVNIVQPTQSKVNSIAAEISNPLPLTAKPPTATSLPPMT